MSDFHTADTVNETKGRCFDPSTAENVTPDEIETMAATLGDYAAWDEVEDIDVKPGSVTVGDIEGDGYFDPLGLAVKGTEDTASIRWRSDSDRDLKIKELDELTAEEKFIVQTAIMRSGSKFSVSDAFYFVNIRTVVKSYLKPKHTATKKPHAVYMSIYRAAHRLQNRGVGTVTKEADGLVWVWIPRRILEELAAETRRKMEAHRERNIDLIRSLCKNPTPPEKAGKPDPLAIPRNAHDERLAAVKLAMGIKGKMNNVDRSDFARLFYRYNDRVTEKIIALLDNSTGELIGSEYSTRFNDTRKAAIALNKFDYVMEQSLRDYYRASLLTLTTDPKRFDSLWVANRSIGEAWNKFMAWLTKRNKRVRPEYIAAYEYTKSGLVHIHAILFMPWVADKDDITKEWERIGHGTVNDVRGLKRQNIKGKWVWKWAKKRPYGSSAAHGGDYLKKYLKKAALAKFDRYDDQASVQAMYWVFNKRFWSCSRRLLPPPEELEKKEVRQEPTEDEGFSFFKVLHEDEADGMGVRIVYRRGGASWDKGDPPDDVAEAVP